MLGSRSRNGNGPREVCRNSADAILASLVRFWGPLGVNLARNGFQVGPKIGKNLCQKVNEKIDGEKVIKMLPKRSENKSKFDQKSIPKSVLSRKGAFPKTIVFPLEKATFRGSGGVRINKKFIKHLCEVQARKNMQKGCKK